MTSDMCPCGGRDFLPDAAETRREKSWLLCPHCLHRWNRNEFDVDAWAACPSCGGSFSYAKPRAIDGPLPAAAHTPTPAPEPPLACRHASANPQLPGEQFQRCSECGIEVGASGVDGGSWVPIDRATYATVTTWKSGKKIAPPLPSSSGAAQEDK